MNNLKQTRFDFLRSLTKEKAIEAFNKEEITPGEYLSLQRPQMDPDTAMKALAAFRPKEGTSPIDRMAQMLEKKFEMKQPKRSDSKYWTGTRNFDEIQYAEDLEKYIRVIEHHREDLAINFAKWIQTLSPTQRVSVWSKDGQYQGLFLMDEEQLLEKFKKKFGELFPQ